MSSIFIVGRVEITPRMVQLVGALVQDGFSREEIAEIYAAAVAHVDGDARFPTPAGPVPTAALCRLPGLSARGRSWVSAPCRDADMVIRMP